MNKYRVWITGGNSMRRFTGSFEVIADNETLLLEHGHMSPGEMARISIAKKFLENTDNITIKVVER